MSDRTGGAPLQKEAGVLDLTAFDRLDRVIHERGRLAIMSLLAANDSLSFRELKDLLGMTDGNLSVHMRTLEDNDYVRVDKSFVDRKPRTEFSLSPKGRETFEHYLTALEEVVRQAQKGQAQHDRSRRSDAKPLAGNLAPSR